ncbi:MAG: phosphatase PAP2 family protein [Coriobacteriales bacterium]|jgi:membrane-associated phospholipid phosphatase
MNESNSTSEYVRGQHVNPDAAPTKKRRALSTWAIVLASTTGVLYIVICVSVSTGMQWVSSVDDFVWSVVMSVRTDAITPFFRSLSFIGATACSVVIVVVFTVYLLVKRRPKSALFFLVVMGVGTVFFIVMKQVVARPRPSVEYLADGFLVETDMSFPSGHSLTSVVLYGMMASIFCSLSKVDGKGRAFGKFLIVLAVAMPILIGTSRLYMGEHFGTDVIAGWLAGATILAISGNLYWNKLLNSEMASRGPHALKKG